VRRLVLLSGGVVLLLAFLLVFHCVTSRMPVVNASEIADIGGLQQKLGPPTRQYRQVAGVLAQMGVVDVAVPRNALGAGDQRELLVEIWERRTCLWRMARFVAIINPADGKVLYHGNGGQSWNQVLVLGDVDKDTSAH
jgi:hypothetical protein